MDCCVDEGVLVARHDASVSPELQENGRSRTTAMGGDFPWHYVLYGSRLCEKKKWLFYWSKHEQFARREFDLRALVFEESPRIRVRGRCANSPGSFHTAWVGKRHHRTFLCLKDSLRRYGPPDVARLQFIRRAKSMGFTLDEIAGLLQLTGKRACEQTRRLTEYKLLDVRRKLENLKQLEVELVQLADDCACAPRGGRCPTLDSLRQEERVPKPHATLTETANHTT